MIRSVAADLKGRIDGDVEAFSSSNGFVSRGDTCMVAVSTSMEKLEDLLAEFKSERRVGKVRATIRELVVVEPAPFTMEQLERARSTDARRTLPGNYVYTFGTAEVLVLTNTCMYMVSGVKSLAEAQSVVSQTNLCVASELGLERVTRTFLRRVA